MKLHRRYAIILVMTLALGACRQADGPMPTPSANTQEELKDVTKDLQNVAGGDPQGPMDLAHDLRKYAERQEAVAAVDELSRRTAQAVAGSTLTEQVAQRLAHNLWAAIEAREISERQRESLQNDVQSLLVSAGVAEERAEPVAAQVGEVQRLVSERPRRWYEWF